MKTREKLVCYLVLAIATSFVSQADKMSAEVVRNYIWWDWLKFVGAMVVSAALVWRAYVDQSLSREGNGGGNGSAQAAVKGAATALVLVGLSLLLAGCATVTQTAKTESTNPTNGVVTVTTAQSRITAWGDAKNVVDKVRASAGKTASVGASGVNEETTTAGLQNIMQILLQGAAEVGRMRAAGGGMQ